MKYNKALIITLAIVALGISFANAQQSVAASRDTIVIHLLSQINIVVIKNERCGNVAERRAKNKKLKEFGAAQVNDNQMMHRELMKLEKEKAYNLERATLTATEPDMELAGKWGENFDPLYLRLAMQQEQQQLTLLQQVVVNTDDTDVKAFAGKAIRLLTRRLSDVEVIASRLRPAIDSLNRVSRVDL